MNGRPVEYYKVASDFFTLSDLVQTIALVSALSPELVIAISCPYLAAEAAPCALRPSASPPPPSSPITHRAKTFSWTPPGPEQQALMQRFGVEDPSLFHMPPGFSAPEAHPPVSRAELGLPADAFVFAVVGVRLDDEVDGRFLDLLETITADPRAHVAMMGRFDEFEAALAPRPALAGRVSFLGFRKDILSVMRVCDAYLNPDRTGAAVPAPMRCSRACRSCRCAGAMWPAPSVPSAVAPTTRKWPPRPPASSKIRSASPASARRRWPGPASSSACAA